MTVHNTEQDRTHSPSIYPCLSSQQHTYTPHPFVLCVNSKDNNIGDEGAKALAPALAELKALTTLLLGGKWVLGQWSYIGQSL